MEFGKAFTYAFEDKGWLSKVIIGGLVTVLSFLILPIPLLLGYMVQTIQNVVRGDEHPLPEWGDIVNFFVKGLQLLVVLLIYFLPAILLYCLLLILGGAAGGDRRDGNQAVGTLLVCLSCVYFILILFLALTSPAVIIRFAQTNQIGAALQLREVFRLITQNLGNYIVAMILVWLAQLIASLGIILCFVGYLFTGFWAFLVQAHLYGQLGRLTQRASPA